MVDEVPAEAAFNAEVSITGATLWFGEDSLHFSPFGAYRDEAAAAAVRAGGGGLLKFPDLGRVVEAAGGDGAHGAGIETLAAEFALQGSMEVGIDGCLDASLGKREFSNTLDFVADSDAAAAEDALIRIPLKKRGKIVDRKFDFLPWVDCLIHSILIDQGLEATVPLFFASGTDHRMIEEDELKLEPS